MRELLQRHEKATDSMITGFDAMIKRFDAGTELLKEQTREARKHRLEMREDHRQFVEEMKAQRVALFRVLDRLDEGGAGAGA